jgi:hypothetical protein
MNAINESTLIEVFAGNTWDAGLVKNLLESAKILTFLKDEFHGSLAPWQTDAGGMGSIKVVVSSDDFEQANEIVEQFYRNLEEN